MDMAQNTHIICFGNPLHGDDGFGSAVFKHLNELSLPDHVRVFDGGTSSLSALNLFDDCDHAIVVDAVQSGRETGCLAWDDADSFKPQTAQHEISSHGLGVNSILKGLDILAEDGGNIPSIEILTCSVAVPETFKMELSPPVESVIVDAVSEILQRLKLGEA